MSETSWGPLTGRDMGPWSKARDFFLPGGAILLISGVFVPGHSGALGLRVCSCSPVTMQKLRGDQKKRKRRLTVGEVMQQQAQAGSCNRPFFPSSGTTWVRTHTGLQATLSGKHYNSLMSEGQSHRYTFRTVILTSLYWKQTSCLANWTFPKIY